MHPKDEKLQPRMGSELRLARMRLDLTQEQVANAVGFVPTVYGRIERGDMLPSTPKLRALCVLLRISADSLLPPPAEHIPGPKQPPEPRPGDSPEIQRLILLVSELPPDRLRLFRVALRSIAHPEQE